MAREDGSPGEIRTPVNGSKARYASTEKILCPLHYRAIPKELLANSYFHVARMLFGFASPIQGTSIISYFED
jgi:hypothetical protein